jgi:ACS family glucarate transporter-like MFS transporter
MLEQKKNNQVTDKPTHIRWRVFGILALASFIAYMLRTNVSIAAPDMMRDIGLDLIQMNWINAAFAAGYALFQFPGGIMGDSYGPRKAITLIAVLWTVFTVTTAFVPEADGASIGLVVASLICVRFLVGAAHAPIFPVMTTWIGRWYPAGSWALPQGLSSTALTLGSAATAATLPFLIADLGWRGSFLVISPLGLLVALVWWWYARDFPEQHAAVNEAELALINADRPPLVEDPPPPPGWIRVLKNRDVLLLTLSYSSMNFIFYLVFFQFYFYLVDVRGFSEETAGFVNSTQWIAGAAGGAIGGWLCERLVRRVGIRRGHRWPIVAGLLISGLMLIGGAYHPNATVASALLAFCFFFNQLTEGPYWSTSVAIGGQFAGSAGGVMNTGANVAGIISPILVAWIATNWGWSLAMASGAGFMIIGAFLIMLVRPDQPIRLD